MKVVVKVVFRDKNNFSRMFNPGEVVDFEEERAQNIIALGLGEAVKEPPVEKPKAEKPVVEKPAEEEVKTEAPAPKPKAPRKKKTE